MLQHDNERSTKEYWDKRAQRRQELLDEGYSENEASDIMIMERNA